MALPASLQQVMRVHSCPKCLHVSWKYFGWFCQIVPAMHLRHSGSSGFVQVQRPLATLRTFGNKLLEKTQEAHPVHDLVQAVKQQVFMPCPCLPFPVHPVRVWPEAWLGMSAVCSVYYPLTSCASNFSQHQPRIWVLIRVCRKSCDTSSNTVLPGIRKRRGHPFLWGQLDLETHA